MTGAVLRTDGGSRGNPGPAGAGFVIERDGEIVCRGGTFLGDATNNVAEYEALIWGLENVAALGLLRGARCIADSELLVKQINGQYRVKNEGLKPLFVEALAAAAAVRSVRGRPRAPRAERRGRRDGQRGDGRADDRRRRPRASPGGRHAGHALLARGRPSRCTNSPSRATSTPRTRCAAIPGECRELHGHTWDVEVTVGGDELDEIGIVYDFKALKDDLAARARRLRPRATSTTLPPFDELTPDRREPRAGHLRAPRRDGRPARARHRGRRVGVADREARRTGRRRWRGAARGRWGIGAIRLRIQVSRETSPAGSSYRTGFPFLTFAAPVSGDPPHGSSPSSVPSPAATGTPSFGVRCVRPLGTRQYCTHAAKGCQRRFRRILVFVMNGMYRALNGRLQYDERYRRACHGGRVVAVGCAVRSRVPRLSSAKRTLRSRWRARRMPTATLEEYLEAIYKLSQHGPVRPTADRRGDRRVGPHRHRDAAPSRGAGTRRRARAPSVRPDRRGHVDAPLDIVRRHRVAETFLVDTLGLDWDAAHEEACLLEHALSPRVLEALESVPGQPDGLPARPSDSRRRRLRSPTVPGEPLCDVAGGRVGRGLACRRGRRRDARLSGIARACVPARSVDGRRERPRSRDR